ncbi:hypothetical protein Fcan01_26942 [Folsomia candida]|uniref:Uncharacterized protein n=1 Tax=Folsomia candida TaxID=158441 RepID=A0A226D0G4_FOLCA|nr:hypothetical protein Fcan01_26942 [Folsomia candida]
MRTPASAYSGLRLATRTPASAYSGLQKKSRTPASGGRTGHAYSGLQPAMRTPASGWPRVLRPPRTPASRNSRVLRPPEAGLHNIPSLLDEYFQILGINLIGKLNISLDSEENQNFKDDQTLKQLRFTNRYHAQCYLHILVFLKRAESFNMVQKSGFNFKTTSSWFFWLVHESESLKELGKNTDPDMDEDSPEKWWINVHLILIKVPLNLSVMWAMYCFACLKNQLNWRSDSLLSYEVMTSDYFAQINQMSNKYPRIIALQALGITFRPESCYMNKFIARDLFECSFFEPPINIVKSRENLTLKFVQTEADLTFDPNQLLLKIMFLQHEMLNEDVVSAFVMSNSILKHLIIEKIRFLYCKWAGTGWKLEWKVFLSPFASKVWALVLVTIQILAVCGLIFKGKSHAVYPLVAEYSKTVLSVSLFFVSGMFNKDLVAKVGIVILGFTAVTNVFLVNEYLAVMTTDFIAYPVEQGISKVDTLLRTEGYRILLADEEGVAAFYLLQKDIEAKLTDGYKLALGTNTIHRNVTHRYTQEMFNIMVETKSCATVAGSTFAHRKIDNDQFTTLGVKCFFLPKMEFVKINMFAGFKYFHAEVAAGILQRIDEAGVLTSITPTNIILLVDDCAGIGGILFCLWTCVGNEG